MDEEVSKKIMTGIRWLDHELSRITGNDLATNNTDTVFENEVFALRAYYWGDCTCDYDELEAQWQQENDHADDCLISRLSSELMELGGYERNAWGGVYRVDRDYKAESEERKEALTKVHEEMGLSGPPSIHCTCELIDLWKEWTKEHDHAPECRAGQANFEHFESGYKVCWYKRIGRGTTSNFPMEDDTFSEVLYQCLESIGAQT